MHRLIDSSIVRLAASLSFIQSYGMANKRPVSPLIYTARTTYIHDDSSVPRRSVRVLSRDTASQGQARGLARASKPYGVNQTPKSRSNRRPLSERRRSVPSAYCDSSVDHVGASRHSERLGCTAVASTASMAAVSAQCGGPADIGRPRR